MTHEYLSGRCRYFREVLDGSNLLLEGMEGAFGNGWVIGAGKPADGILATTVRALWELDWERH